MRIGKHHAYAAGLIALAMGQPGIRLDAAPGRGVSECDRSRACGMQPVPVPSRDSLLDALTVLEKRSWEAWKNRDSAFYRDFLTDDHVEVGFSGTSDKSDVVATVGTPRCVVKSYSVDGFAARRLDEGVALLTYHADQDATCSGHQVPHPVWVSSTYVRRGGRWLNIVYQQTQDLTAPAKRAP